MASYGRGRKRPIFTNKQIADALRENKGLIYLAAADLGCARVTIYKRVQKVEYLKRILDEERGKFVDTAESKLMKLLDEGSQWAIRYVLNNLAKDRGYAARLEITGAGGATLLPNNMENMTDEQFKSYLARISEVALQIASGDSDNESDERVS
jgi:hypothetical protein